MERLIDDLTRLHEELNQGGDGGAFDIAGLAKEARDAIVRLNDFDNSQSVKLLQKIGWLEKELNAYRTCVAEYLTNGNPHPNCYRIIASREESEKLIDELKKEN